MVAEWTKTAADRDAARLAALERITARLADAADRVAPLPEIAAPGHFSPSLLNLFSFFDFHLGMQAWHKEGGADWDIRIARDTFARCLAQMIRAVPPAKSAMLNIGGDFNHTDGHSPVTPTSHHVLDADGRFEKIADTTAELIICGINALLETHEEVIVLPLEGNHDPTSAIWLRVFLPRLYGNNPRVKVITSPLPYVAVQHGKTMLAFHHGHLKKNGDLPLLFAAQFSKIWGMTEHRYCHTGHRHHTEEKEWSGMTVVQHQTLAARDAYAARGGWISDRSAQAITYHSEHGEVGRVRVSPEMVQ